MFTIPVAEHNVLLNNTILRWNFDDELKCTNSVQSAAI